MRKKKSTQEHINKIIEFRQAIHANGFGNQRDALIEALDATCLTGAISSLLAGWDGLAKAESTDNG